MMGEDETIPRGADLTEADIEQLAADAYVVTKWAMSKRIPADKRLEQIRQALRVRLGRRGRTA